MSEFFERVLGLAEEKGHVIYWGTVGFSVRACLPGGRASFVYGFPNGSFSFYFDWLFRAREEAPFLRKRLLALGVFKESGNWTLGTTLTEDNLAQMSAAYDVILDEMEKLSKACAQQNERV